MQITLAIDTSENKTFSCVVLGFQNEIDSLYREMSGIFEKYGRRGTLHWRKMTRDIRNPSKAPIVEALKKYNARLFVFEHPRLRNVPKKKFYTVDIPNKIAYHLEQHLRGKRGFVRIECDDDYFVEGLGERGTERFLENFLRQITFRLTGQNITIRKVKSTYRATIKQDGDILEFLALPAQSGNSRGIQIADIVLGLFKYYREGLEKKIIFRRL